MLHTMIIQKAWLTFVGVPKTKCNFKGMVIIMVIYSIILDDIIPILVVAVMYFSNIYKVMLWWFYYVICNTIIVCVFPDFDSNIDMCVEGVCSILFLNHPFTWRIIVVIDLSLKQSSIIASLIPHINLTHSASINKLE